MSEPLESLRERVASSPYHSWVGVEVEDVSEGRFVMRLDLQPHHVNPWGVVHGGVIAGLLDSVCGLSLRTVKDPDLNHLTLQLGVTYLRSGRTGSIRAIGTAVREGRRVAYAEGEVLDDEGNLLARGTATFLNVPADE